MNDPPGHVCQPTSRADTLRVLYSALSVTVSTFRSKQFTITRVHEYVPPSRGKYKNALPKGTSLPSSPDHTQVVIVLSHFHPHLHSWVATRTIYSPGHLRIPDKANSSVRGVSSTGSKPRPTRRDRAQPLFGVRFVRTRRIAWPS